MFYFDGDSELSSYKYLFTMRNFTMIPMTRLIGSFMLQKFPQCRLQLFYSLTPLGKLKGPLKPLVMLLPKECKEVLNRGP